ncbi:MAG: serine protease [Isosphaeraceae bacterium]
MNRRDSRRWAVLACLLALGIPMAEVRADDPPDLPAAEIARRGKEATSLLEAGPGRSATAFCVHPSGLFVTNDHVFQQGLSGPIKLVVNAGTLEQKVYGARIVRRDKAADLALLAADQAENLPALPLGSAATLAELMEVVVLGFPFGRGGAPGPDQYPSISINRGSISSLRRKDGQVERIQLNAAVNPGNSGGPLLDPKGKVVGVIVGRVEAQFGAGIDLAIPVNTIDRFLARPTIDLKPPGTDTVKVGDSVEFEARVTTLVATETPLELQLVFAERTPDERRVAMTRSGDVYRTRAVPFPPAKGPASVALQVKYADGAVSGRAEDLPLTIDGREMRLGQLESLGIARNEARTLEGKVLTGRIDLPKAVDLSVGGQKLRLDLGRAVAIDLTDSGIAGAVDCTLIALRGKDEVGRESVPLSQEGAPRPSFDAMRDGRFLRPARSTTPVYYTRIESTAGDYIGQGKNYSYGREDITFQPWAGGGLRCQIGGNSSWSLALSAGQGRNLAVAEYRDAKRQPFAGDSPGLEFSGNGRGSNTLSGEFRIWEYETKGNEVIRLAVDFVQRSEGKMPPLVGMLRYNSSYY